MGMMLMILLLVAFCMAEGKLVDLSHPYIDNDTMIWPFYNSFQLTILHRGWFDLPSGERAWLEYNEFSTPEHLGTHMDAPSHLANSDKYWRIHQIPVDRFIGDAVIIDITERAKVDADASLLVSDLLTWEEEHGQIKDGSIVLMYSGWDKYWGNTTAYFGNDQGDTQNFHFPGFSVEASKWLIKNRVISGIGTDTISLDSTNNLNFEAHRIILSENIYGLENVMNLDRLPPAGARLYVFPLKLKDGSGAPCRIIAEFDHLDPTEATIASEAGCVGTAVRLELLIICKILATVLLL